MKNNNAPTPEHILLRKAIARQIREARREAGMRQAELAAKAGVSIGIVSGIENWGDAESDRDMHFGTVLLVAQALGLTLRSPLVVPKEKVEVPVAAPVVESEDADFLY